jgi:hypothetical protein
MAGRRSHEKGWREGIRRYCGMKRELRNEGRVPHKQPSPIFTPVQAVRGTSFPFSDHANHMQNQEINIMINVKKVDEFLSSVVSVAGRKWNATDSLPSFGATIMKPSSLRTIHHLHSMDTTTINNSTLERGLSKKACVHLAQSRTGPHMTFLFPASNFIFYELCTNR